MKHYRPILILGCFIQLFLFTGCVTLYKPNVTHSPMLTEKGQGHASTSVGITGCSLANIQADYAVNDHVGIMANGMYHYRSNNVFTDTELGTQKLNILYGEAGLGMFDKIGESKSMFMQCYTGGGYGKSEARIDVTYNPYPRVTADFYGFFIQPGFLFTRRFIDMGVDMRFKYVKLYNIESIDYQAFDWWENNFDVANQLDLEFMLFEPSFTFSGGGEHIRGIFQTGLIIPIVNSEAYFGTSSFSYFDAPVFKFSMGVSYAFGKKKETSIKP
jgi:hypothetical protein